MPCSGFGRILVDMPLALITGASAGIGRATAVAFARQKWSVAIGARRVERLQRLVPELQGLGAPAVFAERLDVTEPDSVERFTTGLVEQLGVPDCLVNNAGLARGDIAIALSTTPNTVGVALADLRKQGKVKKP